MLVACPNCKTKVEFTPANPFRPFCSERCRLIDLGKWADGSYAIPVAPAAPGQSDQDATDETDLRADVADDDNDQDA